MRHTQVFHDVGASDSLETSTIKSWANHGADPSQGEGGGYINRHAFNAIVSDQDLVETYLPAFQKVVQADAGGIMCSCRF